MYLLLTLFPWLILVALKSKFVKVCWNQTCQKRPPACQKVNLSKVYLYLSYFLSPIDLPRKSTWRLVHIRFGISYTYVFRSITCLRHARDDYLSKEREDDIIVLPRHLHMTQIEREYVKCITFRGYHCKNFT